MSEPNKQQQSFLQSWLSHAPNLLAILICIGAFLFWSNLLIEKFVYFGYYDWDLAIYANAMWALTQGSFSGSLWGTNFLTNHAEYISFFIVPIYKLFPSAMTLVLLNLSSLITAGFILYLIGKEKIDWLLSLILMVLYLTFPANFFMLIFEFHFESLAIVFIFLIYYYLRINVHYGKFVLCCLLASLCKENIPPVIFMFGFVELLIKKAPGRKFAWTAIGIGLGVFIIEMFIITPSLRHWEGMATATTPYINLYWSGQEKLTLLQNLTTNSSRLLSLLFSHWNALYTRDMLSPFLILPLLSPLTLLIGLPLFLQALLSNLYSMHTIYFHYAATVTPLIFLATLEGLFLLRKKFSKLTYNVFSLLLIVSLSANAYHPAKELVKKVSQWKDENDQVRWALIKQIPAQASVTSTFQFLSHLANRDNVYPLRNIWNSNNIFKSHSPFVVPQTDYALIDWNCDWLWGEVIAPADKESHQRLNRLKEFYFNNNWQVKAAAGEITLLERNSTSLKKQKPLHLVEVQKSPFQPLADKIKSFSVNHKFQLLNSELTQNTFKNFSQPLTTLTFYWTTKTKLPDYYRITIALLSDGIPLRIWHHPIGYAVYPTRLWEPGDYIKENYWIDLASLEPGKYSIVVEIKNLTQNKWEDITYQSELTPQLKIATIMINPTQGDITHEK